MFRAGMEVEVKQDGKAITATIEKITKDWAGEEVAILKGRDLYPDNFVYPVSKIKKTSYQELAEKYNLTASYIRDENLSYVMADGFLDDGYDCDTLEIWLEKKFSGRKIQSEEPYQKGDLGYGL